MNKKKAAANNVYDGHAQQKLVMPFSRAVTANQETKKGQTFNIQKIIN